MRWTDLPRDRESFGDADLPVLQRGEWEDLRQRLERLPAGHPSSPDDQDLAYADRAEDGRADEDRAEEGRVGEGRADEGRADEGGDRSAGRGGRTGPEWRARPDGPAGPGGPEAGRALGADRREPYQPWFASGQSPEPWFSADPDA
jgi:hypothetical protein